MKIWNFFTGEFTDMETSEDFDEIMREVENNGS